MKTGDLFSTEQAEARRDEGIRDAIEHAESVDPGWRESAVEWIGRFARTHPGARFLTEDVRKFALDQSGFVTPTDGRAWGQAIRDAARRGLIVKDGTLPAKSSNLSPKVAWKFAA